jgi:hypothetical protein
MTNSTAALPPQGTTVLSWGAKLQPLEHIQTPPMEGSRQQRAEALILQCYWGVAKR